MGSPHKTENRKQKTENRKQRESESVGIRLAADPLQVGLDVAFPIACAIATQAVVAVFGVQRWGGRQHHEHGFQIVIERGQGGAFASRLSSRLKADARSIVRMQVCHQIINTAEPLAFPGF
jgi:hypothetical protein